MSDLVRLEIVLSKEELGALERIGSLAGFETKTEVIACGIALLRWACTETMYGRYVCSIDHSRGQIKKVELPALLAIAQKVIRSEPQTVVGPPELLRRFRDFAPADGTKNFFGMNDMNSGNEDD